MALGIEEDVELREAARQGYVIGNPRPRSFVSGPVAGELLLVLLRKYPTRLDNATTALARFANDQGYLEMGAHGRIDEGVFEIAARLMRGDKLLEPTDAVVAACSLADPASTGLVTADPDILLSSVVIKEFEERGQRLIEFDIGDARPKRQAVRRRK